MKNIDALADSVSARLREHINKRVSEKTTEHEAQLAGALRILGQRVDEALQRIAALERGGK